MFADHGLLAESETSVAEKLRTRDQCRIRPRIECRIMPGPEMAVREIGAPGGLKCAQIFLIAVNETDQDRDEIRHEAVAGLLV